MADVTKKYVPTQGIGMEIDKMVTYAYNQRRQFERKWYENNFFDDGYHFRYVSRTTGKIIDVGELNSANMPQRSIPKASRQLRGIANLCLGIEPTPSIFPQRISKTSYPDPNMYTQMLQKTQDDAKKTGIWLTEEWKEQFLRAKLTLMMILAGKHSVSFMKIWPDSTKQAIKTMVDDAFEVYLMGNLSNIQDSPFMIEAKPMLFDEVASNQAFNPDQIDKLYADNKMANSEVKQMYMQTRFGAGMISDNASTLILKEGFMKERITDQNLPDLALKAGDLLRSKKRGDIVLRHAFSANGVWLMDEYLDFDMYPFVDFRYEPGPIYQKPIMENFIPANKSLDMLVSRLEKWANTMVTGTWYKRKGEGFEITNVPGGQVIEYNQTPPVQANMVNVPAGIFDLVGLLEKFIEEQGASTSALGNVPTGIKSGVAIESIKATEFANLKIASDQMKDTVRRISEMMIKVAAKNYVQPKTVYQMDNNKPSYFDVMGQSGIDKRQELGIPVPQEVIPIREDTRVDIQIESGMGYTEEGRKNTMQQIITFLTPFIESGMFSQDAFKVILQKLMDTYQFGSTQDLMEAMDSGTQTAPLNEEQITQMKVAIVEAMKDSGMVGPEHDQKLIESTKIGVVEALKDTGMLNQQNKQETAKGPSESISFKDMPAGGKVQMAEQAGISISPEEIKQQDQQAMEVAKQNAFNKGTKPTNNK